MGRPPINMSVIISSTQHSRFAKPRNFCSIPAVSRATGISLRAVRNAYHSGRTYIRKASGEVYTLKWMELVTPIDTGKCYYCHRDVTVKDYIRKASGEVYTLKWMELVTPIDTGKCYYCHRDVTVKDYIRKASGEVYTLKWMELVTPIDTGKCYYCHRDVTVKDRSTWFHME